MIRPQDIVRNRGPRSIEIEIYGSCQLRCLSCGRWKLDTSSQIMSFDNLQQLIEEIAPLGVKTVVFGGGEPTLHPQFDKIIEIAHVNNIEPVIYTNGFANNTINNESILKHVQAVVVSLDGHCATVHDMLRGRPGGFERVLEFIQYIISNRQTNRQLLPQIGINHTISEHNSKYIIEMISFAKNLQIDYIRLNPAYGLSGNYHSKVSATYFHNLLLEALELWPEGVYLSSHAELLLAGEISSDDFLKGRPIAKLLTKRPVNCYLCMSYALVDPQGNVFPCTSCRYSNDFGVTAQKARENFIMGNVFEHGFMAVWSGDKYFRFREVMFGQASPEYSEACGGCPFYMEFRRIENTLSTLSIELSDRLYYFSPND